MLAKTCLPTSACAAAILLVLAGQPVRAAATAKIVIENNAIQYVVSAKGKNLSLLARGPGKEHLAGPGQQAVATLKKGGKSYWPTACRFTAGKAGGDGTLVAEFAAAHTTVTVKVRCPKRYLCFEIQSVDDPAVEEVSLLNLVLATDEANAMSGVAADEKFAFALRALNLQTLGTVGGKPAWLAASASRRHGLAGAKAGLAAGSPCEIRQVLKEMLADEGATRSPLGGGPWRPRPIAAPTSSPRCRRKTSAIGLPWPGWAASRRSISSAGSKRWGTTFRARTPFPTAWPG